MTKIATMRGVSGQMDVNARILEPTVIDFNGFNEGELQLVFLNEQLELLKAVYPDSSLNKQWQRASDRILNGLQKGLSNFYFTGPWSDEENIIARAIAFNKKRTNPANGLALINRNNAISGIHGEDVPLIDTEAFLAEAQKQCEIERQRSYGTSYDACMTKAMNAYYSASLLNNKEYGIEKASLQMLYNWVDNSVLDNEDYTFDARYKIKQHSNILNGLSEFSNLSVYNLRGWTRLGIMRRSAAGLGEVLTPEETIAFLMANPNVPILTDSNDPRLTQIGNPLLIIQIAVLVLAAFIGVTGLVQACKGREPTAFKYIRDLGALTSSPGGVDWVKKAGTVLDNLPTGGGSNPKTPLPVTTPKKDTGFDFSLNNPLVIGGGAALLAGGIYYATK